MFKLNDSEVNREIFQIKEYRENVQEADEEDTPYEAGGKGKRKKQDLLSITDISLRCPCCRHPIVARMGRDGPGFYCECCPYEEHGSYS